ncbi:S8 family serine peptidase [Clostridium sp. MSJ-4]|uniref:S8 family serine peptidase n=1 Tax=Clostridium simiarum TaxID=2841506 RepID=A0ABS6EZ50_9CLOT|nr:S8 family serine peptidase [Clostridium simiarum]MBU5591509.1 S8 family serine peptidase [Clostridium simiarum]
MLKYNEIAIIDDGINVKFYNNIHRVKSSIEIDVNCNITKYKSDKIEYSHGTVCASIIKKYTKEAIINSIKIINKSKKTTGKQLIKAIEWCLENNIGIANLSLGSTDINEKEDIRKLINYAANKGMIIIAASSNDDKITYPASFSNVIGVKTLKEPVQHGEYIYDYRPIDGVDILAPSIHKLKNYFEEEESNMCNSFAAPYITAKVYNIIREDNTLNSVTDMKYRLLKDSLNYKDIMDKNILYNHPDWLDKAVIFNIVNNKNFKKNNSLYTFNIIEEKFIYEKDKCKILKYIKECIDNEICEEFDTIVIKDFYCKNFNLNYFAENLSSYNKGLVYVNDLCENLEPLAVEYKNKVWFTGIQKQFTYNLEKYFHVNIPVILIVGEKEEGMLSTLKLQEIFRLNGYRCGVYSDISLAELYNINFLPLKSLYYKNKLTINSVEETWDLGGLDLMIIFIDLYELEISYIKSIEDFLENDIRILINHDLDGVFMPDERKYNINLDYKNNLPINQNNRCKNYNISDIERVYQYIIELYNG